MSEEQKSQKTISKRSFIMYGILILLGLIIYSNFFGTSVKFNNLYGDVLKMRLVVSGTDKQDGHFWSVDYTKSGWVVEELLDSQEAQYGNTKMGYYEVRLYNSEGQKKRMDYEYDTTIFCKTHDDGELYYIPNLNCKMMESSGFFDNPEYAKILKDNHATIYHNGRKVNMNYVYEQLYQDNQGYYKIWKNNPNPDVSKFGKDQYLKLKDKIDKYGLKYVVT